MRSGTPAAAECMIHRPAEPVALGLLIGNLQPSRCYIRSTGGGCGTDEPRPG
jgi:hypothetical protein